MTNTIFILDEAHTYFNAQQKSMIKPLSLSQIHDLAKARGLILHGGPSYETLRCDSVWLVALQGLVNEALKQTLATSTLPICWTYKIEEFAADVPLGSVLTFMNNLTGADIVQILGNPVNGYYIVYRLPII